MCKNEGGKKHGGKTLVGPELPIPTLSSVGISVFKELCYTFSVPDTRYFDNASIDGFFSRSIGGIWHCGLPADTFLNITT